MRLPIDLDGPAPVWPRPVDAALEWWARLPSRGRALLRGVGLLLVLSAATGGLVDGPWGPPRTVLVAARDVAPGLPLTPQDVGTRSWPRDLVPDGALTSPTMLPGDAITHGALAAGEVVTAAKLRDLDVVAGPGAAVVPVPGEVLPALPVGTTIDLAATTLDGRAHVVARAATVVADDGTWRWLRVQRSEVGDVAAGIGGGSLVAAVVRDE